MAGSVLEVAAGSGDHALAFSTALETIKWTPSDVSDQALASLNAWRTQSAPNLQPARRLDAQAASTWPDDQFDAVYCANMLHISPWAAARGLMELAAKVLKRPGGLLALYGPYLEADIETAPSNLAFDADLKERNPDWGLRDREA
ncbi:hypothetical protein LTR94_025278, partial [Friedmanniomyces endolithicus]